MVIQMHPLLVEIDLNNGLVVTDTSRSLIVSSRGSMSSAYNQFNLGVILPTTWIGEELVLKDYHFNYNVIAETQITVL